MVAILAVLGAIVNGAYVVKHWRKDRYVIRGMQTIACTFVAVVLALDTGSVVDMSNISGYLMLSGMALVIVMSVAEGIVDL